MLGLFRCLQVREILSPPTPCQFFSLSNFAMIDAWSVRCLQVRVILHDRLTLSRRQYYFFLLLPVFLDFFLILFWIYLGYFGQSDPQASPPCQLDIVRAAVLFFSCWFFSYFCLYIFWIYSRYFCHSDPHASPPCQADIVRAAVRPRSPFFAPLSNSQRPPTQTFLLIFGDFFLIFWDSFLDFVIDFLFFLPIRPRP